MAKKLKEQLSYGDAPERMDPNLERRLADPEGLYAKNPAMQKGVEDVQRLASRRFQAVADKLKQVTGIQDVSSVTVQNMIRDDYNSKLGTIVMIEERHKDELIHLATEISLEHTEVPSDWYNIEAHLGEMIDTSNFRVNPEDIEDEDEETKKAKLQFQSFDVEDLTDEEIFELEKHKRNIINAIIQGASKKGHYLFEEPWIKERLDEIDPRLYPAYLGIMAINDFSYFTMDSTVQAASRNKSSIAGKVEVTGDDEEGDEDSEDQDEKPDTTIVAYGYIFPILCHEIIKGIEEARARYGLPKDTDLANKVMGQTDTLMNEPMQLRIGPEIIEQLRKVLPMELFDKSNIGLINWFYISLYQIPAEEFLKIIGNAISESEFKANKAIKKFNEILKEAKQLKQEYDDYKEENDITSDDDEDIDDIDLDFLNDYGISRPK